MPEHVQLSLAGIAGQAKEGLFALAVGTGLAVLREKMEGEVERVVGPKGATMSSARPSATATRAGRSRLVGGG